MSKELPPLSKQAQEFIPGTYRHYKGHLYMAMVVGRIEATHEEVVIYQALYGDELVWVRPLNEFTEIIDKDGEKTQRFTLLEPE